MIDVSELMSDPDFATEYTVLRKTGKWTKGRFTTTEESLDFYGPVQPATTKDLEQLPEGDRIKGVMKFFCAPPDKLYITNDDNAEPQQETYVSDTIEYLGERFKVIKLSPWGPNGYIRAFAVRIG